MIRAALLILLLSSCSMSTSQVCDLVIIGAKVIKECHEG